MADNNPLLPLAGAPYHPDAPVVPVIANNDAALPNHPDDPVVPVIANNGAVLPNHPDVHVNVQFVQGNLNVVPVADDGLFQNFENAINNCDNFNMQDVITDVANQMVHAAGGPVAPALLAYLVQLLNNHFPDQLDVIPGIVQATVGPIVAVMFANLNNDLFVEINNWQAPLAAPANSSGNDAQPGGADEQDIEDD